MPDLKLTIVGCPPSPESMSREALAAIESAELLAGGRRLLSLFPDVKARKVEIGSDAESTAKRLLDDAKSMKVAVLASGDPMLHGIGGTFARLQPGLEARVIPAPSAFQELFANLCLPWESVRILSLHGSDSPVPRRMMLSAPISILYCDARRTASTAAKAILDSCPHAASRPAAIGDSLGTTHEKILRGTLSEIAQSESSGLSILALLPPDGASQVTDYGLSLGMPDSLFSCDGRMMTHPEVRAIAISKLRLGPGILWDVGAGSGSVGIEAALICQGLMAFSIEQDDKRIADIVSNAAMLGAADVRPIHGKAPEALKDLPRPRSVFIGGGGKDILDILAASWEALLTGGSIVATAALLETRAALSTASLPGAVQETVSVSVAKSSPLSGSRLMKAENPIDIFIFRKEH